MNMREARKLAKPTERDREVAAEVKANGGTLTAEELAWSRVWDRRGCAWTGPRARAWARREERETGVPHVGTPNGDLYRLRVSS